MNRSPQNEMTSLDADEREPVRVLYLSGGQLDYGGISTVMMNYARQMDPARVHIDFLVHGYEHGPREEEAIRMGAAVIHVPHKAKHYFKNRSAILRTLKEGNYDIVHAHMDGMNGYVLALAKKAGVANRISHCHNTQFLTTNPLRVYLHRRMANRIARVATRLFACSEAAGRFLYGQSALDTGKLTVIKNAITLGQYRFDAVRREQMREKLNLTDRFVIGHIGRFDYQKNQEFLLALARRVIGERPDACFVLVGDGQARGALEAQIAALGLTGCVLLPGFCDDIPAMLSAFDLFVLPSRFEGLGIVLIEAQASGLPCIASDCVPVDTRITDCRYLPLDDPDAWRDAISASAPVPNNSRAQTQLAPFVSAGYDIVTEGKKLQQMYLEMVL